MPLEPLVAAAFTGFLLTLCVMFLVRRIRHRIATARAITRLIAQNAYEYIILDVRSETEYNGGHIRSARNLPLRDIGGNLPTENMFLPIYVYGRRRGQAGKAARILSETGYFNVICYGGFRGWRGPVETAARDEEDRK